ncbi:hypothetical protein Taro_042572 [Colocasia esculenta]|uniref:Uncharacterized protein n=1 Tax=Colocasia esculenta TaxID=4460 RepID=A0A843WEA5_COLES|nr:hypothetical protein [Colocasia esculenta]
MVVKAIVRPVWCRRLVCAGVVQFPTEPVTSEAHPYPPQVRARRTFLDRRPVRSRVVAVQGQYLLLCSSSSSSVV